MKHLQEIKRIISTYGSFSISEVENEDAPIINLVGKDNFELAESFYVDGVDSISYVHEMVVSEDFVEYENLDDSVIELIYDICISYENQMQ